MNLDSVRFNVLARNIEFLLLDTDRKLKILYTSAYRFLEAHLGPAELKESLDYYRSDYKITTMPGVYWQMLISLSNKRGMPRTIGDSDHLAPHLNEFNPYRVAD